MEIKVLGPGYAKCKSTYEVIEKVLRDNQISANLIKVDDIIEIMNHNVMSTPAVVIDGVVKIKGQVPTESEVKKFWDCNINKSKSIINDTVFSILCGRSGHKDSKSMNKVKLT